jgi:hypothetical protein
MGGRFPPVVDQEEAIRPPHITLCAVIGKYSALQSAICALDLGRTAPPEKPAAPPVHLPIDELRAGSRCAITLR